MLFSLVLDPEGLQADQSSRAARDVALEIVRNYGILHISKADLQILKEHLSQSEWSRWREAIGSSPFLQTERNLHELPELVIECLGDSTPGLVVLGPESARLWADHVGLELVQLVDGLPGSKVQAVTADSVTQAPVYEQRKEWSSSTLREPQSGSEVWEQRLRALVTWSTEVKVVDRYGLQNPQLGRTTFNGIPWLVDQIAAAKRPTKKPKLTLMVQRPEPPFDDQHGVDQIADDLWRRADGAIRELELCFIEGRFFRARQHDRYLRFVFRGGKSSRLVTLGNGLDRFSERPIRPPVSFTYKVQNKQELTTFQQDEEELQAISILHCSRS